MFINRQLERFIIIRIIAYCCFGIDFNLCLKFFNNFRIDLQEMEDEKSVNKKLQDSKSEKSTLLPVVRPQDVDIDVEEEEVISRKNTHDVTASQKRRHNWKNTATDDYHFEKFRKQMRR